MASQKTDSYPSQPGGQISIGVCWWIGQSLGEGVLHQIIGVGRRAQHTVAHAPQPIAMSLKLHQAAIASAHFNRVITC